MFRIENNTKISEHIITSLFIMLLLLLLDGIFKKIIKSVRD